MKKIDKRIFIIAILLIIEIVLLVIYFKNRNASNSNDIGSFSKMNIDSSTLSEITENDVTTETTIVSTTAEVQSGLTEDIELHTTYYVSECYVEEGDTVSSGDNLILYTNSEYLTAPYDCIINSINVPDSSDEQCNNNSINISSTSLLSITLSVGEDTVDNLSLGQEAEITISAFEDKTLTGYVTSISNTASNGNFTVVVEFDNDGEVLLGMTAEVEIKG